MKVIDSQTHWYPRLLWEAYEKSFDTYPRCKRDGDSWAYELFPDRWYPIGSNLMDLGEQMEAHRAAGADVVFSSSGSFGDVDRLELGHAKEVAAAVNQLRSDAEKEYPGEFYGVASIPWQDTDAAIAELDHAIGSLGMKAVLVHSNIDGAPVDSEHCRPIWAKLAELGVPVFIHPARSVAEEKFRDYGMEYLAAYMFDTSTAALRLVLSGIMAENPNLKVVHPHCGATLPYLAGRIDSSHVHPYSLGDPLDPLPSEQFASRFWTDTVCQSVETIKFALNFYEGGHVMYGSDYPWFQPDSELDYVRRAVPEEELSGVLGGNFAEIVGIDAE
ncbi:MAG: amidohydrolase family protein [Solirubrobacterales bacterium]